MLNLQCRPVFSRFWYYLLRMPRGHVFSRYFICMHGLFSRICPARLRQWQNKLQFVPRRPISGQYGNDQLLELPRGKLLHGLSQRL